jgi:chorismate mutase/prephenate dehydratase
MGNDNKLEDIRKRIDSFDEQIQLLINERAKCAQEVAKIKQSLSHSLENSPDKTLARSLKYKDVNFYRAEREAIVLRDVLARNQGPLSNEEIARLFREIMSACLALEQPMKIAFLGPEGTFTQSASLKHFGHSVITMPLGAIDEVFREVESGVAHYGVVPVENSIEGVVNHTLDMFLDSSLSISGEVELRIHQHLLSNEKNTGTIKRVYSHQQSLAQCREWLDANLPNVERISVASNAEAARISKKEKLSAAIAGKIAAQIYGLGTFIENIEDDPDNTTRFLIVGRSNTKPSGQDKTSILLSTPNKPGALHRLLHIFAKHDISMTRIESRPSRRGMWDYVFFIDIEGHILDKGIAAAVSELKQETSILKVLGSYPRAVL